MDGIKVIQQLLRPTDTCVFVSFPQLVATVSDSMGKQFVLCMVSLGTT